MPLVPKRGQPQRDRHLLRGLGPRRILLVRKDDDRLPAEVRVPQRPREHVRALVEPRVVARVDDERAAVHVGRVRLPYPPNLLAPAQVEDVHVEPAAGQRLVVEAERGHRGLRVLPQQGLQQRGLTRTV